MRTVARRATARAALGVDDDTRAAARGRPARVPKGLRRAPRRVRPGARVAPGRAAGHCGPRGCGVGRPAGPGRAARSRRVGSSSSAFGPTFPSCSAPRTCSSRRRVGRDRPGVCSKRWRWRRRSSPTTSNRCARCWARPGPRGWFPRWRRSGSRRRSSAALNDPASARRTAEARRRFLDRYTIDRVADEMVRFYDRALGARGSAAHG